MKGRIALLFYCFLFSILFVLFYSLISQDSNLASVDFKINLEGDKVFQQNSVRKDLLPDRSPKVFLGRNALQYKPINQGCPEIPPSLLKYLTANYSEPLTEREKIFAMCKQTEPILLSDIFTKTMQATLTKIGEGAFADVFGCQKENWDKLAVKIIPLEGDFKYNDEPQNTFKSIQTETIVSIELSLLGKESRKNDKNVLHYTRNFMQIDRMAICYGEYPDFLLEAWDDYDFRKHSDNDRPDVFSQEQLYILYMAENSGVQLGSYVYHSFEEAISILQQVSATIAVGEAALQFEHRDLHRGNVLVRRTNQEFVYFRIDGVEYFIKSYGVLVNIVDYTLSRVKQEGTDCVSHVNLKKMPWLFKGKGDIQFDVYRDIKNVTKGRWDMYQPYTNVLWINYIATKVRIKAKLKGPSGKSWRTGLYPYIKSIKRNRSAKEVFLNCFSTEALKLVTDPLAYPSLVKHHH